MYSKTREDAYAIGHSVLAGRWETFDIIGAHTWAALFGAIVICGMALIFWLDGDLSRGTLTVFQALFTFLFVSKFWGDKRLSEVTRR